LNIGKRAGSQDVQFAPSLIHTKLEAHGTAVVGKAVEKSLTITVLPVSVPTAKLKSSLTLIVEPDVMRGSQIRTQAVPFVKVTPVHVTNPPLVLIFTSVLVTVAVPAMANFTNTHPSVPVTTIVFDVMLIVVGASAVAVAVNTVPTPIGVTVVFGPPVNVVPTLVVNVAHIKGSVWVHVVWALVAVLLQRTRIAAIIKQAVLK